MAGLGHISLSPWLHQWLSWLPTSTLQDLIPQAIAYETLGGAGGATFCVLGAQRMLRVVRGDGRVVSPSLPTLSLSAFQLCVKFIKDTLSVEQVCEALQVRVTPEGSQRVKNNLYNFGAGADLTLLFSAGQWGRISHSPLAQQLPCQLPDHWDCTRDARDSGATRAWQRSVFTWPEQGWPELPSARALSSSA